MATYAIGDIQGCYDEFQSLLDKIRFSAENDTLWLVGDLVNRGPRSLDTLRYIKTLDNSVVCVLGNHDLHLLATHAAVRTGKRNDTLEGILQAPDCDELLDWLRRRPILHHDPTLGYTLVHAGLLPQWDLALSQHCARELEVVLQSDDYIDFLQNMYGNEPSIWSNDLTGWERLRVITNGFTRLRYCTADGHMNLSDKSAPGQQAAGLTPWFEVANRRNAGMNIIFGHWSTLGYRQQPGIIALDSGCLWGGCLTAVRLDSQPIIRTSIDCAGFAEPSAVL